MASEKFGSARYEGGMRFRARSGSGHELLMDTAEADGGENAGFSPMELPLLALSGCMGMDVISILRKKRQTLSDYAVEVHGVRAETYPQVYVQIAVRHTLTGPNLDPEAARRAVELSATKYCSVSGMLNKSAHITHTIIVRHPDREEPVGTFTIEEGV